ncbi:hypothetical protein Hanom_Chr09g00800571 [Helianthus anomalus]
MSTAHHFFTNNSSSHYKHTQIMNTKTLIPHTYYPHTQLHYKNDGSFATVTYSSDSDEDEKDVVSKMTVVQQDLAGNECLWGQLVEILKFSGPAACLWLCGLLMSLINTFFIGQSSLVELAALGPGTVLCDYMSYVFMFLFVAASNLVATSLAKKDKSEDSWGPLKALAVASVINDVGDVVLCLFFNYGIVGTTWATMES